MKTTNNKAKVLNYAIKYNNIEQKTALKLYKSMIRLNYIDIPYWYTDPNKKDIQYYPQNK